jgi:hypothetical protein
MTSWGQNDGMREAFENWVATLEADVDALKDSEDALDDNTDAQREMLK